MKIRQGFVSNSSSSSFVIKKADLTELQIKQIKEHWEISRKIFFSIWSYISPSSAADEYLDEDYSGWKITETEDEIKGFTNMNNYGIGHLLEAIGIPGNKIKWSD